VRFSAWPAAENEPWATTARSVASLATSSMREA
jgi:hypothetical protein